MVKARIPTTSLWTLVDAMQRRLEGEGLEAKAVDTQVARGLVSLLCRDVFGSAHPIGDKALDSLILEPEPSRS